MFYDNTQLPFCAVFVKSECTEFPNAHLCGYSPMHVHTASQLLIPVHTEHSGTQGWVGSEAKSCLRYTVHAVCVCVCVC